MTGGAEACDKYVPDVRQVFFFIIPVYTCMLWYEFHPEESPDSADISESLNYSCNHKILTTKGLKGGADRKFRCLTVNRELMSVDVAIQTHERSACGLVK